MTLTECHPLSCAPRAPLSSSPFSTGSSSPGFRACRPGRHPELPFTCEPSSTSLRAVASSPGCPFSGSRTPPQVPRRSPSGLRLPPESGFGAADSVLQFLPALTTLLTPLRALSLTNFTPTFASTATLVSCFSHRQFSLRDRLSTLFTTFSAPTSRRLPPFSESSPQLRVTKSPFGISCVRALSITPLWVEFPSAVRSSTSTG